MTYCIDLNLDYDPIINKDKFLVPPKNNVYMSMFNLYEIVNPKFIIQLNKLGITLATDAELFYTRKEQTGILHRDISLFGPESIVSEFDYVKINFCFGGSGSLMNWYSINEGAIGKKHNNHNTGVPAERYTSNEVTLAHSAHIGYPSIVQVGIPHDISNNLIEDRYVICLVPIVNRKRITMEIALDKLQSFIGVPREI